MKLEEAKRDLYRRKAKEEGYRSRAAFKLLQLNNKYRIIRAGYSVVDIGAAPGGWLEVAAELVGQRGVVVGVDIVPVKPVGKNAKIILEDVTSAEFPSKVQSALGRGKADCVLADMSPKLSGIWDMDHFKQIELCQRVVDILPEILASGGSNVMKAFHGEELDPLIKRLRNSFHRVEISKPDASRSESSEVYLVSMDFTGRVQARPSEDLPEEHQSEQQPDSTESDWQSDRLT
ncbi:MAG: RlmE family RNA methyltransferase [Thaumarchaeota archaeon]|nr:RlmE family RNA methyltransferase [Nitrososphaerota archaeon]